MFTAKILLFGEYGIIENSMGLSIPFNHFGGALKTKKDGFTDESKESNRHLSDFVSYLKNLSENNELIFNLDIKLLENDVRNGMYFDSSIPKGFGIGSSGALCASVYDKYAKDKITEKNLDNQSILDLKSGLAQMESFFHGKSSGLDPLICYLNLPVLVKSGQEISPIGLPEANEAGGGAIFLINSGTPGQTQSMVTLFLEKCKTDGFRNLIKTEFKKYNDMCIDAFLRKDFKPLFSSLKELSSLVFEHFQPMIPEVFKKLWKQGIETNAYYLKLCGSGGGGYILGFTKDYKKAEKYLKDFNPHIIYKF
ncbi:MAG: mevalonate kinase [Bacteroidetes bacterium]|nr:mevalonate kinase [Bacteroidota bacterium]